MRISHSSLVAIAACGDGKVLLRKDGYALIVDMSASLPSQRATRGAFAFLSRSESLAQRDRSPGYGVRCRSYLSSAFTAARHPGSLGRPRRSSVMPSAQATAP